MVITRRRTWLLLAFLFVVLLVPSARAQGNYSFLVTSLDAEQFPDIRVGFRAIDSAGNVVPGIDSNGVAVYENGEAITGFQLLDMVDGPSHVVFVVDLGQQNGTMDAGTRRQTLLDFATNHFRDGVDTAAIITLPATDSGTLVLGPTSSRNEFIEAVNSADLNHDNELATRGLLGVERALEIVSEMTDPNLAGTAVVFLTDSIFASRPGFANTNSDAQNLNAVARGQHVPLYVLQTDDDNAEPLDSLVENTGGTRVVLGNNHSGNQSTLGRVYGDIMARGLSYEGEYRSPNGESGDRRVTVLPTGTPLPGPAGSTATYSVTISDPVLVVTSPADGAKFTRTGKREDGVVSYSLDSIDVTAEIREWPDQHPRGVMSAELVVNGTTKLAITPDPTASRFNFLWDITDIRTEGTNTQTIQTRIRDEFGRETTSPSVTVQIVVAPPPPLPTPPPDNGGPVNPVPSDPCVAEPNGRECWTGRALTFGPWIALGILAVLFLFMFRRLNEAVAAARVNPGTLREKVTEARKTLLGGGGRAKQDVLAKLVVITARPDLLGQVIELDSFKKTIGRDPRLSDIQLYYENEPSSVSGLHCTIQYDRARRVFLITDNNSSNGTTINDRRLEPDDPATLADGDVIVLGHLFQQGAKLKFEAVKSAPAAEVSIQEVEVLPEHQTGGTMTEMGTDDFSFEFTESGMNAGDATLLDTEMDVIDIVPPDPGIPANKKDDRKWLDELE